LCYQDLTRQDVEEETTRMYRTTSAPPQVKALLVYWLIRTKQDRYVQNERYQWGVPA